MRSAVGVPSGHLRSNSRIALQNALAALLLVALTQTPPPGLKLTSGKKLETSKFCQVSELLSEIQSYRNLPISWAIDSHG